MIEEMSEEAWIDEIAQEAAGLDWCELAGAIIDMEILLQESLDPNYQVLLGIRLEIFELTKANMVTKEFNTEHFINKNHDYYDGESF